jgi:arsenate reductase
MKIAFICTGNSARSQMAEGFAKYFAKIYNKNIEIYSAGSNPTGYVHPLAIEVMKEISIDISNQYSKSINEIPYKELNLVITVCGDAKETCPVIPGIKREHWEIPDPVKFEGLEEEKLNYFRKIRDEIKERVERLIRSF